LQLKRPQVRVARSSVGLGCPDRPFGWDTMRPYNPGRIWPPWIQEPVTLTTPKRVKLGIDWSIIPDGGPDASDGGEQFAASRASEIATARAALLLPDSLVRRSSFRNPFVAKRGSCFDADYPLAALHGTGFRKLASWRWGHWCGRPLATTLNLLDGL
jgi:hypothetical protein